ncbi:hypothetical protein D3C73_1085040 [compost metagenome]
MSRLRLDVRVPTLRCAHDRPPALRRAALPSLRLCRTRAAPVPQVQQGRLAPRGRRYRTGRGTPGDPVPGLSRTAGRPRQHVAQGRHEPAVRDHPERPTLHPGGHADARQGPPLSTGNPGLDPGCRWRAVLRRLPRQRAHGATDCPGRRSSRPGGRAGQGDHPDTPGRPSAAGAIDRTGLLRLCRAGLERAARGGIAAVCASGAAAGRGTQARAGRRLSG